MLTMVVTDAGLDALVNAENGNTDPIVVSEVGLSSQEVAAAPTLEVLPGEFKRLNSVSGDSVAPNIIHMTAQDPGEDVYELRSIALYLSDGTMFAVYGQADPIFTKVSIATFLLALDVAFSADIAGSIQFGDATFLYPPATETVKGVAELATQEEVNAGTDDERIVTAMKLAALLAPLIKELADEAAARAAGDQALQSEVDAEEVARTTADGALQSVVNDLLARTITGSGLVSGGGNLHASRVLNVAAASAAEALGEAINNKALTPATFAGFARQVAQSGYAVIPGTGGLIIQHGRFSAAGNSPTSVTWPTAFPSACYAAICNGALTDQAIQDNYAAFRAETISATGAVAYNNQTTQQASFIAIGR